MNLTGINKWRLWRIDGIGAAICVAMTLATYFLAVRPRSRRHDVFAARQAEFNARQSESHQLSETARELERHKNSSAEQLQSGPLRLETPSETNRRLAKITDLANACGLKVNQIAPDALIVGARYGVVPIRLSGTGRYPTCVQFLRRLHEMFPDTAVAAIDLGATPNNPEDLATFKFNLEWYTAPADTPKG